MDSIKIAKKKAYIVLMVGINNFEELKQSDFTNDKDFMLNLIRLNYKSLEYISDKLKNDKDFILTAIKANNKSIQYIPKELMSDEFFLSSLSPIIDVYQLIYSASLTLIDDQDFLMNVLKINYMVLNEVFIKSKKFKNDENFFLQALEKKINGSILKYASEELKKNEEFILKIIKFVDHGLMYISEELKENEEFILKAINININVLSFVSKELMKNVDFVSRVVSIYGSALRYASEELRDNKYVVSIAVANNGSTLLYASKNLQDDKEVVLIAVANYGLALSYASKNLQDDKDVVLIAVENKGRALVHASNILQNDEDVVLLAVENDGMALEYANNRFKENKEIVLKAIQNSIYAFSFVLEDMPNYKEIFLYYYRYININKIPNFIYTYKYNYYQMVEAVSEASSNKIQISGVAAPVYDLDLAKYENGEICLSSINGDEIQVKSDNPNDITLGEISTFLASSSDDKLIKISIDSKCISPFDGNKTIKDIIIEPKKEQSKSSAIKYLKYKTKYIHLKYEN